jgi:DNA-binding LacI/PurR family transcriptional regulator
VGNRVTLQTVADAVGVSRTTVSNAYNRPDQLAPELRDRILAAARGLGYAGPDPAARRLRSGRGDAVGVMLSGGPASAFADPGTVLLIRGIARVTADAGVALLLVPERAGVRDAVVDAICLCSMAPGHPGVAAAAGRGVPLVVVDEPRLDGHGFVGVDDRRGARLAAEHRVALGHRRVALVTERREAPAVGRARFDGYREALRGVDWTGVEAADGTPEQGAAAAREALAAAPRPTALIAGTDQLALGALAAAREAGLRVPEDVSVVGFDDLPGAAWARPALTTVRQPLLEKGEAAGRMLTGGADAGEAILPVDLVVRASTAPPP